MHVFVREMRRSLKGLLLWCAGIAGLLVAGMGKYAGMRGSMAALTGLIDMYPAPMRAFFGMDALDLSKAIGFYGVMYLFLLLIVGVHAAMLGANMLAKEERDHTAEFLLVRPVSRRRLITEKVTAAALQVLLLNVVTGLVSLLSLGALEPTAGFAGSLVQLMVGMLLFQWVFLSMGVALGALTRKAEKAAAVASYLLLGAFMLALLTTMAEPLAFMGGLLPFGVFAARRVLAEGGLPWWSYVYALAAVVLGLGAAYCFYPRRDIQV